MGPVHQGNLDRVIGLSARADHVSADYYLGAEPERLGVNRLGQLLTAYPIRESREVLDARARSGLPSGRMSLDDNRVESLRSCVDGSSQPGGTRPDNEEVV
jgi:hypothetical protein